MAFDPNDREMPRRIDTPQPEPADPLGYPDDDDELAAYDDTDEDGVYRAPVARRGRTPSGPGAGPPDFPVYAQDFLTHARRPRGGERR
ncbi:hypothetical protein DMH04_54085 [Kibdelosporangium aridum]|uniref:Uncharacterized protein n=2 Tax=Kibdelosporangium aridum TaxID=2030 RepID=A0A428XYE2_KIBAR|nr:hypothetical protein DMH04_54085 [Kibdelosporangium aridum]